MEHIDDYQPFNPAFKANPFPYYARLRADEPISRHVQSDGRGYWLVTRYDDVLAVLRDPRFIKNWRAQLTPDERAELPPLPPAFAIFIANMLDQDPPNHTRLRALVSKAFTPRLIENLRPRIQQLADGLLDTASARGEMDLIDDYAFPIPITVIAELLGVPAEDREKFRTWSNAAVSGDFSFEAAEQIAPHMEAFADYLRALFEERRRNPRADLISGLLRAEEAGDRLSEEEMFAMIFLLLIAGHETTVNLIGNGLLALLEHPDELQRVQQDPELIKPAVEELLRYAGPVETSTERYASEDVTIGNVTIPKGEMALVVLGSANRDGEHFTSADDLDITRDVRDHLAFGHGIHYCLGAPLARLEAQIAIGTIISRFPNMRLAADPSDLAWRPGMIIRGLTHLPVILS